MINSGFARRRVIGLHLGPAAVLVVTDTTAYMAGPKPQPCREAEPFRDTKPVGRKLAQSSL